MQAGRWIVSSFALGALASLLVGCTSEVVSCGPGTEKLGDTCIPSATDPGGSETPTPPAGDPGGMEMPPPAGGGDTPPGGDGTGGGDGGGDGSGGGDDPGFGDTPPGGGGGGGMGCDPAMGECAMWADEIARLVGEAQAMNGCGDTLTRDMRLDSVAAPHATHQATIDMLDATSPDGDLFDQIYAAGVEYSDVAAAFSLTYRGPDEVVTRWAGGRAARILMRCDTLVGVGVDTSSTGATFVTLLVARE